MLAQHFLFSRSDRRKIPLRQLPRYTKTTIMKYSSGPNALILISSFWTIYFFQIFYRMDGVQCHFNENKIEFQSTSGHDTKTFYFCHFIGVRVLRSNSISKCSLNVKFSKKLLNSFAGETISQSNKKEEKTKYFITISHSLTFCNVTKVRHQKSIRFERTLTHKWKSNRWMCLLTVIFSSWLQSERSLLFQQQNASIFILFIQFVNGRRTTNRASD